MKKLIMTALLIAAASGHALAADSLSEKIMKDNPGVTGPGKTANPTGIPADSSISQKAMRDAPGVSGSGSTANPTAKPTDSSLAEKQMKDSPGVAQ